MPPAVSQKPQTHPGLEHWVEAQKQVLTASYDQARAYSHVVLGIGYVSIFAAWSFTREFLSPGVIFWSAFLASISVFMYVIFDVISMFYISKGLTDLQAKIHNPAAAVQALAQSNADEVAAKLRYMRIWIVCWLSSVVTGVAAAFILLGAFFGRIICDYFL